MKKYSSCVPAFLFLICLFLLSVFCPGAQAAEKKAPYQQTSSPYFRKPGGYWKSNDPGKTLVGGVRKLLLGWTEIITEPVHSVQEGGNPALGIAQGLRNAVVDTADGIHETLTFPFD